jgi:hypothetical protein
MHPLAVAACKVNRQSHGFHCVLLFMFFLVFCMLCANWQDKGLATALVPAALLKAAIAELAERSSSAESGAAPPAFSASSGHGQVVAPFSVVDSFSRTSMRCEFQRGGYTAIP